MAYDDEVIVVKQKSLRDFKWDHVLLMVECADDPEGVVVQTPTDVYDVGFGDGGSWQYLSFSPEGCGCWFELVTWSYDQRVDLISEEDLGATLVHRWTGCGRGEPQPSCQHN